MALKSCQLRGFFCVWNSTLTQDYDAMHNCHHLTFFLFGFFFLLLKIHINIPKKHKKNKKKQQKRYQIWTSAGGKCCSFVRETSSTIVGAKHFCRMLCVIYNPKTSKVPLIPLFNTGMCFLQCVFSIQMQYNIQSAIYTSRNCLHILIRPWFRDCCS